VLEGAARQALQRRDEAMDAVGWEIETKELDGDETIALGIEAPKHRTQRARTDLMKNSKRTEGIRRRTRSVGVQ
jgi:hypothetical protein